MLRARLGACLRFRLEQKYVIMHSGSFTVYFFLASGFGFCLENKWCLAILYAGSGVGVKEKGGGVVERIEVLMGILPSSLFEGIATRCPSSCWPLEFLS